MTARTGQEPTVAAIRAHHDTLARGLAERTATLRSAADRLSPDLSDIQTELVRFCETQLLPHAAAEEETLYQAAANLSATALLVSAMTAGPCATWWRGRPRPVPPPR
ncbi:hypothetical protein TH66_19240 [Carbonactinospora thermoautotrophica]|uniref:Hemerythrin HHE cation binding domain protein n=1 Tax=Carbonactinospora thermoautotrophica TaxID=1469144 RepID=A0A132MSN4_9ACTN|nr:hemerythrin domain-containing protein [Carbonactinospora thermoautotrophica]KWW97671.1 hypothetical protein TH66_19240 [Carbonactinospora thermoautotrophica]KWX00895.1 Hemerythrin HHE cation binding domain protein [Carbonactinospora thermoautotrophica]KWX03938.1 hypothetical protein TR74_24460 [Carbonactinospora thermoautotrophica]